MMEMKWFSKFIGEYRNPQVIWFSSVILIRLGRISFRTIKQKRDYLGKRKSASWMYMSRLAAQKEYAFMKVCCGHHDMLLIFKNEKVLYDHGFQVPRPIDQARHCILMELIDAYPL